MGPEPIWGSPSKVHSARRSQVSSELSQSRSWAVFITVMNASQRNDMPWTQFWIARYKRYRIESWYGRTFCGPQGEMQFVAVAKGGAQAQRELSH
jgi:hypothetical protein